MKKFEYRLETVLRYKTQMLDDLKVQHAAILHSVNRKQEKIHTLNQELTGYEAEFNKTKASGASIADFRLCDMCITGMVRIIDQEKEKLQELKVREQKKKEEVIEAKTDTSKFEKLKEKRFQEYNRAAMKAEEAFIEEFVAHGMSEERR